MAVSPRSPRSPRSLFSRGPAVPEPVRRAAAGKVLAWAEAVDGTLLAGTRDTWLRVPTEGDVVAVPWEHVHRADWDTEERVLTVERVESWGSPTSTWRDRLDEPGALLVLLRERVTASIVLQRRVDVRGKKGFSVVARRPPGGAGAITWSYQFDPGVDPDDPSVMALAEAALAEAQESLGLR